MENRQTIDIKIRYGGSGDALAIRRAVFMEEQGISLEDEMDDRDPTSYHLVVYRFHDPVATARFYAGETPGQYVVGRVAVLREFRGQGFGCVAMEGVKQWAIEHGVMELRLSAQDPVIPFYQALGYVLTDEPGFLDAGIPHHAMVLDLRDPTDKTHTTKGI